MKFPRVIRLDDSDEHVYARAATAGEWAVTGSFTFWDAEPEKLTGKPLQAFRQGFLGVGSFGWSSLVQVAEIGEVEYKQVIERLATHLVEHYGAPDVRAALPAAREEAHDAAGLCDLPLHTLLAIEREFGDEGIVERLKIIQPNAGDHGKVKLWAVEKD